jgi:hypothetical protein
MEKNVFENIKDLDSTFLSTVYEDDAPTAVAIFEQYLQELPADLYALYETFHQGDRETFRKLVHKKKVGFSYVGLTDVTAGLNELEHQCSLVTDINHLKPQVDSIFERIHSSTGSVRSVLLLLQQQLKDA